MFMRYNQRTDEIHLNDKMNGGSIGNDRLMHSEGLSCTRNIVHRTNHRDDAF